MSDSMRIVRDQICSKCVDYGSDGECHSHDPQGCAIFRFLPQLLKIAKRIHDERVESYDTAVREQICPHCANCKNGSCDVKRNYYCALDLYLPMLVTALQAVPVRHKSVDSERKESQHGS